MRCDISIVSCKRDLHWLSYCLRLLRKNWQGDSRIIVRADEDCRNVTSRWEIPGVDFYYVNPWPDSYAFQMFLKMVSDDYTDAELVLCVDSDLMCLEPASLDDLMMVGYPIIYYRNWEEAGEEVARAVWREPTSRVMGMDLDKDYMVRPPFLYWRDTFGRARHQIARTTRRGFFESVYSAVPFKAETFMTHPHPFADFEALGLCAAKLEPARYRVIHHDQRIKKWPFRLYWSHGDWNQKVLATLEAALKE